MTTKYERGRAIEYRIQRELEANGFTTIRAAGSKGKADVIAWDEHIYRHIQAKSFITRPGSFADDIEQLRSILCPANARKELWVWKHREGWQAKLLIGSRPEEDRILPIDESDHGVEGYYWPAVIADDGHLATLHQPLSFQSLTTAAAPDRGSPISRRAYGTPITITCIGTQNLRDVLSGVRSAVEEAGLEPVLQHEVPKGRKGKKELRSNQRSPRR